MLDCHIVQSKKIILQFYKKSDHSFTIYVYQYFSVTGFLPMQFTF